MITNKTDISLALAVWLLSDDYDYISTPNYVSATALMKPLRHIILGPKVEKSELEPPDVEDFTARAMGHAMHDSIEKAWSHNYQGSLARLGYPAGVIERIKINPTDDEVRGSNSIIPVYLEQRAFRELTIREVTYTIGGKFDMVTDGIVQDTKSTSAYTWVGDNKDEDYRLQMSIYRWIDAAQALPKIKEDYGQINFIFTDWQRSQAKTNPKYPQSRIQKKEIPLLSLQETEAWVRTKLELIQSNLNTPEPMLPECTDKELWRSDPVFKYYADPNKTVRATKNFDTMAEASAFMTEKGKGIVHIKPGEPKRCSYCEAFSVCSQRTRYFDGP